MVAYSPVNGMMEYAMFAHKLAAFMESVKAGNTRETVLMGIQTLTTFGTSSGISFTAIVLTLNSTNIFWEKKINPYILSTVKSDLQVIYFTLKFDNFP